MRKIALFFILALVASTVNAKTVETILWNDTYTDGVELNSETVADFKAGDVLRVYVTVPADGGNFKIVYKGDSNGWTETKLPSTDEWPWVNGGETYKDITLTSEDIAAIDGLNIYIYNGSCSVTKVSLMTEEADEPQYGETTLWEDTYTDGVEINSATVATFTTGDVLRVYVTVPDGGGNFKIVYKGEGNGWAETKLPSTDEWPWVNGDETYKDITLTTEDIAAIDGMNIYLYKGENSTIDKVTLLAAQTITPDDPTPMTDGDYSITIHAAENGTVTGDHTNAKSGETIMLTIKPTNDGYKMVNLKIEQVTDGESDQAVLAPRRISGFVGYVEYTKVDATHYTFTMPANNVKITAVFTDNTVARPTMSYDEANNKVTLRLTIEPTGDEEGYAANAKIYYTIDNTDPATSTTRLESTTDVEITVTKDMTIVRAVGVSCTGHTSVEVSQEVSMVRYLTVAKQWTVFCSPETFAVPEGLKAYTVSSVTAPANGEAGSVVLTAQNIIAQGVPMVIEKTAAEATTKFRIENTTGTIAATDQCEAFKGSATGVSTLNSSNVNYVLKDGMFIRTTAAQVSQYNCYLELSAETAQNAPRFNLVIGGNTTGIKTIGTAVCDDDAWYTLHGVRMAQPVQKGIYIHNGRKVLMK